MCRKVLIPLWLCAFPYFVYSQSQPECKTFDDIYGSGEALCNTLFDDSFVYVDNEPDQAYTMWFFDESNPNDQITSNRGMNTTDQCLLDYFHRDVTAETGHFSECHPWKEAACCYEDTVKDVDTMLNSYGPEYRWDRCGPLSQACERFFVQEACFYECDANVGLYRYQGNHSWKMHQMPIKSSYCNAWFRACRDDYFCAADGGSYFSCAMQYKALDETDNNDAVDVVLIAVIVIIAVLLVGMTGFVCFIRSKERTKGNAYFAHTNDSKQDNAANEMTSQQ